MLSCITILSVQLATHSVFQGNRSIVTNKGGTDTSRGSRIRAPGPEGGRLRLALAQGPDMPHYKATIGQAFALGLPARGPRPRLPARAEPNHQGWRASAALRRLKAAPSHRPALTSQFTRQRHSTCPESAIRERSISLTTRFKIPFVGISHHKIQLSREFGRSIGRVLRSERR